MFLDFVHLGCRAWIYLDSDRREKGKLMTRAFEATNLGFEPNTSAYCFFKPEKNNLMTSNQAKFDEYSFSFRMQEAENGRAVSA
jgi:hypothetical protein